MWGFQFKDLTKLITTDTKPFYSLFSFLVKMARKPVVAGMFYSDYEFKLNEELEGCFNSEYGPGMFKKKQEGSIIGMIVPHAGYAFSGPCAAFGYKELAESEKPDLYIILGISHEGRQGVITTLQDFETPLGVVKTDKEFGERLIQNSELVEDDEAHEREHSIEVQLPFLQFVDNDFKILAIEVGKCNFEGFADKIVQLSKK